MLYRLQESKVTAAQRCRDWIPEIEKEWVNTLKNRLKSV